jgi:hypothetical protein
MSSRKSSILVLILSALLLLVLKHVVDQGAAAIPRAMQLVVYVSLPACGGLVALTLFSLIGGFLGTKSSEAAYALRRISEDPPRNFLIGFLATAYLGLIRSPLMVNAPSLSYVEWALIAVTIYVLYTATGFSSGKFDIDQDFLSWKKHVQRIRPETGRDLVRIASVMEQFVNDGSKEPLLIYLTLHLQRLGETEEDILQVLNPLIAYREPRQSASLFSEIFSDRRRKRVDEIREARKNLLNDLIRKIERV